MTKEEIMKKLDVGFHSKEGVKASCPYMRLECLRIAFDVAHKAETFDSSKWPNKSLEAQLEAFDQVYELAEMNYKFVVKDNE